MTVNQLRDKIRGLSNPEGVNQYTKGGGGNASAVKLHLAAADAHANAAAAHSDAHQDPDDDYPDLADRARSDTTTATQATHDAPVGHRSVAANAAADRAVKYASAGEYGRASSAHLVAEREHRAMAQMAKGTR